VPNQNRLADAGITSTGRRYGARHAPHALMHVLPLARTCRDGRNMPTIPCSGRKVPYYPPVPVAVPACRRPNRQGMNEMLCMPGRRTADRMQV
jgi:hypothetical protein